MHGWFDALVCTSSQHTHGLDLTLGTHCNYPHGHSKLHSTVYFLIFNIYIFFWIQQLGFKHKPAFLLHSKHLAYSSAAPGNGWEGFRAPLCDCPQICLAAKLLIMLEMLPLSSLVWQSFICLLFCRMALQLHLIFMLWCVCVCVLPTCSDQIQTCQPLYLHWMTLSYLLWLWMNYRWAFGI